MSEQGSELVTPGDIPGGIPGDTATGAPLIRPATPADTVTAAPLIRPATPADTAAVAEIWRDGWGDGHLGHVPEALVAVRTPEWFDTWAAQRIGNATVATVGGEIAGFIVVINDEVEQVYVAKRHRGAGTANALLAEAERQVAAAGHPAAWLAVVDGNARARRFYERNGWRSEGLFHYDATTADGPIPVPCHRYTKPVTAT